MMTNLYANNSYLARACYIPFVLIWMIIRAYQSNPISFSPLQLIHLDPRSLFTYSLTFSFLAQFAHDFLLCYMNYRGVDGDDISPENSGVNATTISSSSTDGMTTQDSDLYDIVWYLDASSMGLIITCLFALQAYWSIVMGQLSRRQFTSTLEYWTYLVLAILILPIFPILEFIFHTSIPQKELIPDLVFSCLSILICLLSIRTQFGITTLINTPTRNTILPQTHSKLVFFQDLNLWLIITLFIWNASSLLLCVYSLFIQPNDLTGNLSSKFITDLLSANSNFGQFIVYIILISIIHPEFSMSPLRGSPKRAISSPYNVTKPKTFDYSNFDVGNFHELNNNNHTAIDIPQDISPVHSDTNSSTSSLSEETSQTKSSHSKYSATSTSHLRHKKKHSKHLKSRGGSGGKIEKSGGGFSKKRKNMGANAIPTSTTPLMPTGGSAIEDALAQQIMVETRQDVIVEPAYMHAYINPHIPSPRYVRSPSTSGSRPTSTTTDLLLAPLPSPYSDFAVTRNTGQHPSTAGRNGGLLETERNGQNGQWSNGLNQHRNGESHRNGPLLQQQDLGTLMSSYNYGGDNGNDNSRYGGRDTRQRSVRNATPPIPQSPSYVNQQNRSHEQGNPILPIHHQQQFTSQAHQQIYSPSPRSAQFHVVSPQQPISKRNSLSSHQNNNTMLSRNVTRIGDAASSANRNSMASSNDGDGSGISEDEMMIRGGERNRARVKRASRHQQTRSHEETLGRVQESDSDNGNRSSNPVPGVPTGNDVSYVAQLRGRQSISGSVSEYENRYEEKSRRQESGSESNSLSRRVSGSSRRSMSEAKEYDEYLRPPTSTRSLRSSGNRESGASYSA